MKKKYYCILLNVLVIVILPFIIYLHEYDSGLGIYEWHSTYAIEQDLYYWVRSKYWIVVCAFMAVSVICILAKQKSWIIDKKILLGIGIAVSFIVLSTVFSINQEASVYGNYYQFESVFVQIGYLITFLFMLLSINNDRNIKVIYYCLIVLAIMQGVIGYLQLLNHDPMNWEIVQRSILPKEYESAYVGNIHTPYLNRHVALTMFNSNYAGQYLAVMEGFLLTIYLKNKRNVISGIVFLVLLPLLWFTYSRGAILSFLLGIIVITVLFLGHTGRKYVYKIVISVVILVIFFVCIDRFQNYYFLHRIVDKETISQLKEIVTESDCIAITYGKDRYSLSFDSEKSTVTKNGVVTEKYPFAVEVGVYEEQPIAMVTVDDMQFIFVYADYYFYITQNGNVTTLDPIEKVNMYGYETLGSGRLYIWSRIIPLLTEYLIVGSGPDTFVEVFPQDDYVGKALYCKDTTIIIEKAHNMYLSLWIQDGLPVLILLLVFIVYLLMRNMSIKVMNKDLGRKWEEFRIGSLAAVIIYLLDGFFVDSNLFVSPIFWILAAMNLAIINFETGE